jgi:hypothetical protein
VLEHLPDLVQYWHGNYNNMKIKLIILLLLGFTVAYSQAEKSIGMKFIIK